MSRYRLTELAMWGDDRFRALSKPTPNGQTIWQFLLTGPYTTAIPGIVKCKPKLIAAYYDWDEDPAFAKAFAKAFEEVRAKGLFEVDPRAGLIWLPGAAKPQRAAKPTSPNVVRGWPKIWSEVPECPLKHKALWALKGFVEGLGEGYAKAFMEAFPKALPHPLPNQEQEQEQEQEPTITLSEASDGLTAAAPSKPNTSKPKKPRAKKPKPDPTNNARRAADYLRDHILASAPNCAASRMASGKILDWARDLDALQSLSPGHSWPVIRETIDWLFLSENGFVVQSPKSLAEKWDRIQANRGKSQGGASKEEDPYDRAARIKREQAAK